MRAVVKKNEAFVSNPEAGMARYVLASSQQMMLVRHEMRAGWKGARHSHPQEQLVYVISGRLKFTCGSDVFDLIAGDSLIVAANVEHEAAAIEDSEVLDIFTPLREEYLPGGFHV